MCRVPIFPFFSRLNCVCLSVRLGHGKVTSVTVSPSDFNRLAIELDLESETFLQVESSVHRTPLPKEGQEHALGLSRHGGWDPFFVYGLRCHTAGYTRACGTSIKFEQRAPWGVGIHTHSRDLEPDPIHQS
jgi:hypothetical protein